MCPEPNMDNVKPMEDDAQSLKVVSERRMNVRRNMEVKGRCDVQGRSPTIEGGICNEVEEMTASQSRDGDVIYDVLKLFFAGDLKDPEQYKIVQRIKGICEEVELPVRMVRFHYNKRNKRYKNASLRKVNFVRAWKDCNEKKKEKCLFSFYVDG